MIKFISRRFGSRPHTQHRQLEVREDAEHSSAKSQSDSPTCGSRPTPEISCSPSRLFPSPAKRNFFRRVVSRALSRPATMPTPDPPIPPLPLVRANAYTGDALPAAKLHPTSSQQSFGSAGDSADESLECFVFTWGDNTEGQLMNQAAPHISVSPRQSTPDPHSQAGETSSAAEMANPSSHNSRSSSPSNSVYQDAAPDPLSSPSSQKGVKNERSQTRKPFRLKRFSNLQVTYLDCGASSTFIVTEGGHLWGGGQNHKGQVCPLMAVREPRIQQARHLQEFENLQVKSLSSGEDHTVIVLESGAAISFGSNEFGQLGHGLGTATLNRVHPRPMVGLTTAVVQVACGLYHTLVLCHSGQVYSCGNGSDGCLGRNEDASIECWAQLSPIPALMGIPVQQIASGTEHSMALSLSGKIFTWGRDRKGRLGLGGCSNGITREPTVIEDVPSFKYIAAGPNHSAALASEGKLHFCGDNSEGQLAHDPEELPFVTKMSQAISLKNCKIRLVACGDRHTVIVNDEGRLFTFGRNAEGQLGSDSAQPNSHEPVPVDTQQQDEGSGAKKDGLFFYAIAAGRDHTVAAAVAVPSSAVQAFAQSMGSLSALSVGGGGSSVDLLSQRQQLAEALMNPSATPLLRTSSRLGSKQAHLRPTPLLDKYRHSLGSGDGPVGESKSHSTLGSEAGDSNSGGGSGARLSLTLRSIIRKSEHAWRPSLYRSLSSLGSREFSLDSNNTDGNNAWALRELATSPSTIQRLAGKGLPTPFLSGSPVKDPKLRLLRMRRVAKAVLRAVGERQELRLPAGCSVGEILSLIESVKASANSADSLSVLKKRLSSVMADPHCFNCSFLLPGRSPLLDPEGVEEVFDEINSLDRDSQNVLHQVLYQGALDCVSSLESYAKHLTQEDQVRCLLIILQSRFLENPAASNVRLLDRLSALVFRMPPKGRRAIVSILRSQYPSHVFGSRIVNHLKIYINCNIETRTPQEPLHQHHLWHGIILLQLAFVASMEWAEEQRDRTLEVLSRSLIYGKIPLESFVLTSLEKNPEILHELALFREFSAPPPPPTPDPLDGRPTTTRIITSGGVARPDRPGTTTTRVTFLGRPSGSRPEVIMQVVHDLIARQAESAREERERRRASPEGSGAEDGGQGGTGGGEPRSDLSTDKPGDSTSTLSHDGDDSSFEEAHLVPLISRITGRPRGIFDPSEALRVREKNKRWTFFLAHQNLCPLKFKRNVIMVEAMTNQERQSMQHLFLRGQPYFFLPVRRDHIVEDTMNAILITPAQALLKPLKVIFDGEEGVDAGGLKREFFNIIVETFFNPAYGMFTYDEDSRVVWFNRLTLDNDQEFFLVGVVLGLALYNDILLNLRFPMVVWKKLLDQPVEVHDLTDVFASEGQSFIEMLEWSEEKAEEFDQAFNEMTFEVSFDYFGEIKTQELKEGGKDVKLNYKNREEYVSLYVDYLLNRSIAPQFEAFKNGFLRFQTMLLKTLSPAELYLLVCGSRELDFEELRAGAQYDGYAETDSYIKDFWETLNELDLLQKKQFLKFCTGTDRVPLGGLRDLHIKIQRNGGEPTDRLPTAYTCFNVLLLPVYANKAKLKRLLVLAVEQSEGFGLQ